MKLEFKIKKDNFLSHRIYRYIAVRFSFILFICLGFQLNNQAQTSSLKNNKWYFGIATAANMNFYNGITQELNQELIPPVPFNKGKGIGLYAAAVVEYHPDGSAWSVALNTGYDSRKGKFNEKIEPCGCTTELTTNLSYISFEPTLQFVPLNSDFFLFFGPRIAFNLNKSFNFRQESITDIGNHIVHLNVKNDFSNINTIMLSMQIGAGYDILLTKHYKKNSNILTPFISFQPYFGQQPRSIESWSITTLRVGVALKYSTRNKISILKNKVNAPMYKTN